MRTFIIKQIVWTRDHELQVKTWNRLQWLNILAEKTAWLGMRWEVKITQAKRWLVMIGISWVWKPMLWKGVGLNWAFRNASQRSINFFDAKARPGNENEWRDWSSKMREWNFVEQSMKSIKHKCRVTQINSWKDESCQFRWPCCIEKVK